MAYEKIFSDAELVKIIDDISELLGKESFVLKKKNVTLLNHAIQEFLTRLTNIETKMVTDYNLSTSLMEQQANSQVYLDSVSQKIRKSSAYKDVLTKEVKEIFTYGYVLVLKIRQLLLNEEIKYSVAYRSGNTSFEVSEEAMLKRARISVSSLQLAIKNGQVELDVVEKVKIGKRLEKDALEGTVQSGLKGNTKWSRGLAILETLQKHPEISGGSRGLNFGHFYEAYMYFSKNNAANTPPQPPDAVTYASYMLALRNPTKFYGGGDYEDYQLKTNEATITHLSTIRLQLKEIQSILNSTQTLKQKTNAIKQSYISAGGKADVTRAVEDYKDQILDNQILNKLLVKI